MARILLHSVVAIVSIDRCKMMIDDGCMIDGELIDLSCVVDGIAALFVIFVISVYGYRLYAVARHAYELFGIVNWTKNMSVPSNRHYLISSLERIT
eukprot:scaffold110063_cov17-Prasinocladus_malaysianus.AAC.3